MFKYILGNGLWTLSNWSAHRAYRRALRNPRETQLNLLQSFLRKNAETDYGRKFGFDKIETLEHFRDAVPVVTYDDFEPWIEEIRNGRHNVLTAEPVLMMEKTSGSSGAAKYIPYTASLRREFQQAIGAWMFDLFTHRPSLLGGAQYWSISPAARTKEYTPGGLPVGFEDDSEYLSPLARTVIGWVMSVPSQVCHIHDMEESRRVTLDYLMRCPGLRFISVWNPSFLTILMRRLPEGTRPRDYWPKLSLISCWTSGVSSRFAPELRDMFPGVEVQGKGLLATEGVVSFPQVGRPAPSIALTSHFFEFVDSEGRSRLADELEVGERYTVLMTTGGGFARYALGDQVQVVAPNAIEFIGKASNVSDMCGEKLSEAFVARAIEEASGELGLTGFAMLAPEWGEPPHYVLFVESDLLQEAAESVERRLRQAVHYDYCRRLGQLGPVQGVRIIEPEERYLKGCEELGQRPGNIKPAYLRREFGWRARLEPVYVG